MTDVLVRLTTPSSGAAASGWVPADEVAAVGHLECRPWAPDADGARLHLEAPDRLLLPTSMPPVRLVAGEATLHLAPTGAGWCWQRLSPLQPLAWQACTGQLWTMRLWFPRWCR